MHSWSRAGPGLPETRRLPPAGWEDFWLAAMFRAIDPLGFIASPFQPALVLSQPRHGSVTLSEAKGLPHVSGEILHLHYVPVQNDIIMKLTEC